MKSAWEPPLSDLLDMLTQKKVRREDREVSEDHREKEPEKRNRKRRGREHWRKKEQTQHLSFSFLFPKGFVDLRSAARKITGDLPTCRYETRVTEVPFRSLSHSLRL
jgi:hypothetical protein